MTEKLVSDIEMASLAEVAQLGMQTEVEIYARTTNVNYSTGWDDSSGTSEQYATTPYLTAEGVLPKGWIREVPNPQTTDEFEQITHTEDGRLFLPLGIPLSRGDKVVIEGSEYRVIDDNSRNTYRVLLRVSLRRSE